MLGLDNAGKTTLLKHLAHENEIETTPTLVCCVLVVVVIVVIVVIVLGF